MAKKQNVMVDIETITGVERFKQCLNEAWNTAHGEYCGEFDNIDQEDIASVLYKALHELDMIREGELTEMHHMSRRAYERKLVTFLERWGRYCDNSDDIGMYSEFVK